MLFLFLSLCTTACMVGLDRHTIYNSDYIIMARSVDITKNKKKGKACTATPETNQDMVFEAAKLGGLKKEIVFIEKVSEGNQFCTIVYGE